MNVQNGAAEYQNYTSLYAHIMNNPQQAQMMGGAAVAAPAPAGEEPFYVNAKQYNRILKRRDARARFEARLKIARKEKGYMHESRHKHAMRRPRGPGGRFLSVAELAALAEQEKAAAANGGDGAAAPAADASEADELDSEAPAQPAAKK